LKVATGVSHRRRLYGSAHRHRSLTLPINGSVRGQRPGFKNPAGASRRPD